MMMATQFNIVIKLKKKFKKEKRFKANNSDE